jgi:DNA-binding protein H-NS
MTDFNVEAYSDEELGGIRETVERELVDRKDRRRKEMAQQIRELAATLGMTPEEVLSSAPTVKKARAKVAPKYQHPDNEEQTWSGRGRQPKWMQEQIAAGKTLDDLAITFR